MQGKTARIFENYVWAKNKNVCLWWSFSASANANTKTAGLTDTGRKKKSSHSKTPWEAELNVWLWMAIVALLIPFDEPAVVICLSRCCFLQAECFYQQTVYTRSNRPVPVRTHSRSHRQTLHLLLLWSGMKENDGFSHTRWWQRSRRGNYSNK